MAINKAFGFHYTKYLLVILLALGLNISFTSNCQAQDNVRVLIYTGGHDFERAPFFKMFEQMPNLVHQELIHPPSSVVFDSALIAQFDVLLFYDMVQEIDAAQKAALIQVLEAGKGVVFLHHSLASYQEWDEFEKIIGGRYILDNENQSASTYKHDVNVPVTLADRGHPITRGLTDFIIRDEVYGNFTVLPSVHPLLKTAHPESSEIIGWTNDYGQSRIVYIQLGHDHFAYESPYYRQLLKQAIDWVQNKKVPMVKYTPDFEFKEGIYLNIDDVRNNDPIPLARIITDLGFYSKDFIRELLSNEKISLYDDYGIRRTIRTNNIWGYAESGRLYIMLGGQFQRIIIQGSISLFTASATTQQKTPYAPSDTTQYKSTNDIYRSFYRKRYYYENVTGERREYLFDMESNTLNGFNTVDLGILIERDSVLSTEYESLKNRDKKKRMLEFIRAYNQQHPLYFPGN